MSENAASELLSMVSMLADVLPYLLYSEQFAVRRQVVVVDVLARS